MTMEDKRWWIRTLRLSDLSSLRPTLANSLPGHQNKTLTHFVRLLKESCQGHVYLIGQSLTEITDQTVIQPASEAVALVGIQLSNEPALLETAAEKCIFQPNSHDFSYNQAGRLFLFAAARTDLSEEGSSLPLNHELLITTIQKFAFNQLQLFRLTWLLDVRQLDLWQKTLAMLDWQQTGFIKKGLFDAATSKHLDAHLYSCYAVTSKESGLAFTLFRQGVLAISGHPAAITQAGFTHFGQQFQLPLFQAMAEWLDLLDPEGHLADEDTLQARFTKDKVLYLDQTPLPVKQAAHQAAEYFAGQRKQFDLPLELDEATAFQKQVLDLLAEIPYGETRTYGDLARLIRPEDARAERVLSRAVGHACGSNPLPLFLPCHRVIGSDGKLTGFSGGLDIKEYLLAHEIMGLS